MFWSLFVCRVEACSVRFTSRGDAWSTGSRVLKGEVQVCYGDWTASQHQTTRLFEQLPYAAQKHRSFGTINCPVIQRQGQLHPMPC